MLIYVDDIVLKDNNEEFIQALITQLSLEFTLKDLRKLHYFLGLEVQYFPGGITLSQGKYTKDLLNRANLIESSHFNTPMALKSQPTPENSKLVNAKKYQSLVSALQYLTYTRPTIVQAVNKVCQTLNEPIEGDMKAVKRILHYLKGTMHYGIKFLAQSPLKLYEFCDADWVGCPDTRKSITGYCIYLGANCISWSSKKQPTVLRSSSEAEYRSMHMFTINPNASGYCYEDTSFSWNKRTDCCSWNGIHCDVMTGQVIELDIRCSELQGKFHSNSSLFQLFNLKRLDLSYNISLDHSFHLNLVPHSIWNSYASLMGLYLSGVNLTGQIPESFSHLTSLVYLDLSYSNLSGNIPNPSNEFKSKTLVYVSLKKNQLQGLITKSLLDHQELQLLILSQNNFSGQIASTVCIQKTLRVLDLGSNHLNGPIPQCLGELRTAWILDLSNYCLSGTINTTFNIGNQLIIINLYGNKLKGKVPPSLINCRYLEFFDLGNNELNVTFPSWLGGLPDLQILSLSSVARPYK
ncbi:hypothetical protein BC332_23107 [Capsicum chinense]|nr:hypothetical protein BC332_23107 [Capsicum chinense]